MSKQSQGNAKRSLVAVLLALTASTHCLASMQEMGDEEIQGVVGQDGLSIVLSNNFGYRWKDIPAVDGVAPAKANGFRFVAPRRPMYDANQMTEFDNEYLEISDYFLSTSDYAPITDPMKLDLVTLPDGKGRHSVQPCRKCEWFGQEEHWFHAGAVMRGFSRITIPHHRVGWPRKNGRSVALK
jgi:hypothetical protein